MVSHSSRLLPANLDSFHLYFSDADMKLLWYPNKSISTLTEPPKVWSNALDSIKGVVQDFGLISK